MKLNNLQEAKLYGRMLPGMYQRYDAYRGDEMELVEQRDFRLELDDKLAIRFLSELTSDEFAGLHDGDFYGDKYPAYVNTPYYQRLMKNDTIVMCGADWGENGDWYYAFDAPPEGVYRVIEDMIRDMPAQQFEQEVYDEKTEENVREVLDMYKTQLQLKNLQEASYHNAGTFHALMLNYFEKTENNDPDYYDFSEMWIPRADTFPWFKEIDMRGPDYSVDEQISFIGQDPKNEGDVWVEYEMDKSNGDWTSKDHAMEHIIVYDEVGKKMYP